MLVTVEQPSSKSKAISTAVLDDFDTTATLGVSDSATAEFHSDNLPSPSLRSTVVTSNTVAMTVATKTTPGSENITSIRQSDKKPRYGFLSSLLNNNSSSLSLSSTASGSDTSNKKQESGSKYKLFKPWGNPQDSEYKAIEKALMRKHDVKLMVLSTDVESTDPDTGELATIYRTVFTVSYNGVLKTTVIPWLKKYTVVNSTDKGIQRGRLILLKWWNILVENLPNTAYTDRSLYFECILSLMTRSEYEEFDRIGSINHIENNDTEIPIEMVNSYRAVLMTTLHYAIDRLNQKGVYSNVISFCARVLALCFFKIPGVGFALLHALPVNRFHIKRLLREAVGDDYLSIDQISKQNNKIVSLFPEHLKILCFSNLQTWWGQIENAKRIWGEPPIEMNGNWMRRWQSDDSELFFSFYKHYHVVLKSYLATHLATLANTKSMTPPYQYITSPGYIHLASFFLLKIESLVNRSIHIITTVIQFEHSKNIQNSVSTVSGVSTEMNSNVAVVDTYATAGIGNSTVNGDIANTNTNISGLMNSGQSNEKPKVLEVAEKRFVETMVSIAENGVFQEMCNAWTKALIKKTNMYDVEGVFCLLDFIGALIVELDSRDNAIVSSESMTTYTPNSNDTFDSLFSPPNLTNILDVTSYISLVKIILDKSDHTITILRTISFVYTHFPLLTSRPVYLKQLVKDVILDEDIFERMICHWSRNIRIYFMRLLVWRVGRIGGGIGKRDDGKDFEGDRSEEEDLVVDILLILQNRLENLRLCYKFLTNYAGNIDDVEQGAKSKNTDTTSEPSELADDSNSENQKRSDNLIPSPPSSITSDSKSSASSAKKNKILSMKGLISSSSKDPSTAAALFRWIFSNKSHKPVSLDSDPEPTITINTPPTPIRTDNKQLFTPVWSYAPHRHTYAGKAIVEYEAVNQEYAEWCAQVANVESRILLGGYNSMTNYNIKAMAARFPVLTVEYPKYFGNSLM